MKTQDMHPTWEKILDFQSILLAGTGAIKSNDQVGREFDAYLKSGEFRKTGLDEVATTLMENIQRLCDHAFFPTAVFNYGRLFQEKYTRICLENNRTPFVSHIRVSSEGDEPPTTNDLDFMVCVEQGLSKWMLEATEHSSEIGWITNVNHVAGVVAFRHDRTQKQIESFASSLVIQAWTLLESTSEDLWEAALNFHPARLSSLSGKPRSKFRRKLSEEEQTAQPEKYLRISLNELERNSFNVSTSMGTILKDHVSFRSLSGVREAYHRAFSKHAKPIDEILDDEGLQFAAAVRNLLIHKRGIVDEEFLKQVSSIPNIPKIEIGQKFPLNGKLTAALADSSKCCAVWLVVAVHQWLLDHIQKAPT